MSLDYKEILNNLPILVYVAYPDAVSIQFYNETWTSFTGFSLDEMKDGWGNVVHPDDISWMLVELNKAVSEKRTYHFEFRLFRRSLDAYVWVSASCKPIINEQNEVIYWVGTITDINTTKLSALALDKLYTEQIATRETRIAELEEQLAVHKTNQ